MYTYIRRESATTDMSIYVCMYTNMYVWQRQCYIRQRYKQQRQRHTHTQRYRGWGERAAHTHGGNVHVQELVCAIGAGLIFHGRDDSFPDAILLLYAASALYTFTVQQGALPLYLNCSSHLLLLL